jgi:hypothetical protein
MLSILKRTRLSFFYPSLTFSTNKTFPCWKCGAEIQTKGGREFFCEVESCGAVQPYKLKDVDVFSLFAIESSFDIDITKLDAEYKRMQMLLHPDKFANHTVIERNASNVTSSCVNEAYQVNYYLECLCLILRVMVF